MFILSVKDFGRGVPEKDIPLLDSCIVKHNRLVDIINLARRIWYDTNCFKTEITMT